ncbi:MAG: carbohydrate ABC transporter permease [Cellulosilyticaceae bacterium]
MRTKGQRKLKHQTMQKVNGFVFILPWILGFILFFAIPLWDTIIYSFCEVGVKSTGGMELTYSGIQNYINLLQTEVTTQNQPIMRLFVDENVKVFTNIPLIVTFSLFMALLANAKFKGRGAVRVIFFLPIILGLDVLVSLIMVSTGGDMAQVANNTLFESDGIVKFLMSNTFLPPAVIGFISGAINNLFTLITQAGLQTLIFLAALQSISPALYEVAKIEGATSYEVFWKVTIPSIKPIIVFITIYTLVDLFLSSTIATEVYNFAFTKSKIGIGSALSVVYMANVLLSLGILLLVLRGVKMNEKA